ncbi:MAG: histidine phosphatase family protein [Candidatus Heimdallarchaeota archaeon]
MKFYLVRHGQSEDNINKVMSGHRATPLTDLGREQAQSLGQQILEKRIKFDVVYSSDLKRASETATIICNELGIENITFDKRLREGDAGDFTGRLSVDITKEEREYLDSTLVNLKEKIPGGESNYDMTVRIQEAFYEIVENHPEDSTILLVGHGGTLYHILVRILDLLPGKLDEWFGNCMLNILERDSKSDPWKITMFNNQKLQEK